MFDDAVKKVVEDVIAKSNFAMDHMLEDLIKTVHDSLNEATEGKSAEERLELIGKHTKTINVLAKAVQKVKE